MFNMSTKAKIILAAVALLVSFAFGRFLTPVKTVEVTKTVEVEKKADNKDENKDTHKETTSTTVTRPDGSKETTTKVVEDTTDKKKQTDTTTDDKSTDKEKIVTRSGGATVVSIMAAPTMPSYGLSVSHEVLGPIMIGAFGFTTGPAGVTIGLRF